jgi:hypothetical protein
MDFIDEKEKGGLNKERKSHVVVFTDPLLVTGSATELKREKEQKRVTSLTGIFLPFCCS